MWPSKILLIGFRNLPRGLIERATIQCTAPIQLTPGTARHPISSNLGSIWNATRNTSNNRCVCTHREVDSRLQLQSAYLPTSGIDFQGYKIISPCLAYVDNCNRSTCFFCSSAVKKLLGTIIGHWTKRKDGAKELHSWRCIYRMINPSSFQVAYN